MNEEDFQRALKETLSVIQAVKVSGRLPLLSDGFNSQWNTLESLTSSYFSVSVNISDHLGPEASQCFSFVHQVMAHSVLTEMHRNASLDLENLNIQRVRQKFYSDIGSA